MLTYKVVVNRSCGYSQLQIDGNPYFYADYSHKSHIFILNCPQNP